MAKTLNLKTIFSAVDKLSGPAKTITARMEKFGKVGKITGKALGAAAKASAAIGAAAVVAGAAVGRAAMAFAERGDDIARNAAILGLTTTAYQELSYAARMADVDQEAFASASKKLSKNLGDLKAGEGTLYTTLQKTNPALTRQLRDAKDTDAAFSLVAQAISKETDVQRRAALAQAAFGKTGQDLIPMMEGLAAAREEARASGSIIDEADVAAASRLDDALKRIKAVASGPLNSALAAVATRLAPIVERVTAWITANRELIGQRMGEVLGVIERVGGAVFRVFQSLAPALEPLWNLVMSLVPAIEAIARLISAVVEPIARFVGSVANGLSSMLGGKGAGFSSASDLAANGSLVNIAPASSSSSTTSRSEVAVNFANLPAGASVQQSGNAPGFSLSVGRTMAAVGGGAH